MPSLSEKSDVHYQGNLKSFKNWLLVFFFFLASETKGYRVKCKGKVVIFPAVKA